MDHSANRALQHFKSDVGIQFQLYNSLFTSLPFHRIEKTGILLSLLLSNSEDGYLKNQSPVDIIEEFFSKHTSYKSDKEKLDLLFRFVQYAERQVVLFDALEDAAFRQIHDMNGPGTLKHLESEVVETGKEKELSEKLKDFCVRLVLTAHPTQFYPGSVLGIINDLSKALMENNTNQINMYLQQLGKTPFFKKEKPSPYDEALNLVWFLENVFYQATGRIINFLKNQFPESLPATNPVIKMGFWPGGDRDGNPFVNASTTLKVAEALRGSIIKCYYLDVRRIKRRLTFEGVEVILAGLEKKLYNNIFIPGQRTDLSRQEILDSLYQIRDTLIHQHNSLFLYLVDGLINKVLVFGLHFASLDIRQDSSKHTATLNSLAETTDLLGNDYQALTDEEKIKRLSNLESPEKIPELKDPIEQDCLHVIPVIKTIQEFNGEEGCNRYIISQCNSALNVMEVYGLLLLGGWEAEKMSVDIIPLFETIDDLRNAATVMKQLYESDCYRKHLHLRNDQQTIMVGFSDGTKDGGYLMANWRIYKAKEELTALSKEYGVSVVFFDGRGGPPARGGGKTHKFYASMGKNIANKEIQLTIQGQTVSSNFGMIDAAQFNMEQLVNAGVFNELFSDNETTLTAQQEKLIAGLADDSYEFYTQLKNHPYFLEYLGHASPLKFYAETNIGSRPAKRGGGGGRLSLKDLRAIPFVGAWSQLKQNVTGYYGVGTALKKAYDQGKMGELKQLYKESLFFRTLIDNCEMAMKKCFFPLTAFLSKHPLYGEIWNIINAEYELTKRNLQLLTGKNELMAEYPVEQLSIQMRERIVLPLVTIQQYAITRFRELEQNAPDSPEKNTFGKLVMRCSFGIINAGRNSA
ncbi:MAG TPA: phosphoenolpyruvate carboxylase [Chitinophagaceae bacterium]|nr:phosphoenolpyruvate carboxylase [Chitinophagaceae bacterium]